ncbi:TPA: hypothetical protein HA244_06000 [Candidatus Micrarchaeota archaeon]|nr:hypothetical protein [Candidatus Micrarchaeota archaeon]
MAIQEEYEALMHKVASLENVNLASAKKALTELLDERYYGCPNALRYRAFTELRKDEVARARKYLVVYLQSTRFRGEFKEMAWLLFSEKAAKDY